MMADGYHWYVRNTFVKVVPASVLTPSIDNPGVRRSSSAPPNEVRLLRLGLMVDTASSSVSIHVPDPSPSPAPSTSLVRLPLADITKTRVFRRQPESEPEPDPQSCQHSEQLTSWPLRLVRAMLLSVRLLLRGGPSALAEGCLAQGPSIKYR